MFHFILVRKLKKLENTASDKDTELLINKLVVAKSPRLIKQLIQCFDSEKRVVKWAIRVLGEMKDPLAVDALIQLLNWKYSSKASNSLVNRSAQGTEYSECFFETINALGKIGDSRAIETLIPHLQSQKSHIRLSAIRALGNIKDLKSAEILIPYLNDPVSHFVFGADFHFSKDIQLAVIKSLGKLGFKQSFEPILKWVSLKIINKDPGNINPLILEAIQVLGLISDANDIKALLKILVIFDSKEYTHHYEKDVHIIRYSIIRIVDNINTDKKFDLKSAIREISNVLGETERKILFETVEHFFKIKYEGIFDNDKLFNI